MLTEKEKEKRRQEVLKRVKKHYARRKAYQQAETSTRSKARKLKQSEIKIKIPSKKIIKEEESLFQSTI